MPSEPTPLEVNVSSSIGGKVQIIKFEYSEDYHYYQSEKWQVPEDWDEDQIAEFREHLQDKLNKELEAYAQKKVDELVQQREELNG